MAAVKLCECGCGEPTKIAPRTHAADGWIKGQPIRFVRSREPPLPVGALIWGIKVRQLAASGIARCR